MFYLNPDLSIHAETDVTACTEEVWKKAKEKADGFELADGIRLYYVDSDDIEVNPCS